MAEQLLGLRANCDDPRLALVPGLVLGRLVEPHPATLHELERLQARRENDSVPPPAVADVNVTLDDASS